MDIDEEALWSKKTKAKSAAVVAKGPPGRPMQAWEGKVWKEQPLIVASSRQEE